MTEDEFGEWPLTRHLTEKIGSGPRSADDLTYDEAYEGFARLLDGSPDPATASAFLLANRWKTSTPEELAGFVDAMRERSVEVAAPAADPVDCGANYDGKRKTALLGVAAGLVAAAAGTPVVAHSGPELPAKQATTYRDVLDALGVATDLAPSESARMTDEVGFGFYYQPRFNPKVDALRDLRESVAVRTSINTVETLANPADASTHLGSFYHLSYAERLIETVRRSETLPNDRVLMVKGLEGYDDVRPGRATVGEWQDGMEEFESFDLRTPDLGYDFERADLEVDDVRTDSARLTEAVLAGEHEGPVADAVAVNAGLRIYAGGDADSVADGVEAAEAVLDEGSAAGLLAELQAFEPTTATADD